MEDKELLKQLRVLGFSLFEREEKADANFALAQMAKSKNLRLWEGFPVVLANGAKKGLFDYGKTAKYLENSDYKDSFDELLGVSLALYEVLKLKAFWVEKLVKGYLVNKKEKYLYFLNKLKRNQTLKVAGRQMDSRRLKSTFNNYYSSGVQKSVGDLLAKREEFNLEYCLAQVFSPKQKELFLKKLKGQKLSKTEKEYFSRVVRKKVKALANSQLHRLAQKLIE
jgi:hypothetical protein